jgi:hypothetical protein
MKLNLQTQKAMNESIPKDMVDGRPAKPMHIYTVESTYAHERERIVKDIKEQGGEWAGMLTVRRYNYWGDHMGFKYVHVYQSEEELSIAVWT